MATGAQQPHLAVKVATTPAAARVIEREADFLVARWAADALAQAGPALPRHAGVFEADGLLAVATSVVPGVPMRAGYHAFRHLGDPASVRADFTAAAELARRPAR